MKRTRDGKLDSDDVRLIRLAAAERDRLRKELAELTDSALAVKFEVSVRTVTSVINSAEVYS